MRETAYNTLVRPQLEYAAPIWDPYTKEKTLQLEKIKRRAARWTTSNYDYLQVKCYIYDWPIQLENPWAKTGGCPPLSFLQDAPWNCGSTPPRLRPAYTYEGWSKSSDRYLVALYIDIFERHAMHHSNEQALTFIMMLAFARCTVSLNNYSTLYTLLYMVHSIPLACFHVIELS